MKEENKVSKPKSLYMCQRCTMDFHQNRGQGCIYSGFPTRKGSYAKTTSCNLKISDSQEKESRGKKLKRQ
jgi:hypothetical protein